MAFCRTFMLTTLQMKGAQHVLNVQLALSKARSVMKPTLHISIVAFVCSHE